MTRLPEETPTTYRVEVFYTVVLLKTSYIPHRGTYFLRFPAGRLCVDAIHKDKATGHRSGETNLKVVGTAMNRTCIVPSYNIAEKPMNARGTWQKALSVLSLR